MSVRTATLCTALLTPTDSDGLVDLGSLSQNVDFVLEAGVDGICVSGAIGGQMVGSS